MVGLCKKLKPPSHGGDRGSIPLRPMKNHILTVHNFELIIYFFNIWNILFLPRYVAKPATASTVNIGV